MRYPGRSAERRETSAENAGRPGKDVSHDSEYGGAMPREVFNRQSVELQPYCFNTFTT